MFIVNKEENFVVEVKQIEIKIVYDEKLKKKVNEMHAELLREELSYRFIETREEIEKRVAEYIEEYAKNHSRYAIFINKEHCIGDYDALQSKVIFNKILTGLKNGENIFEIREIEI